ncbi:type IV secretion system component VirD4 [Streptococcus pneumoniae]|nr:type IV secretion system component VirD4 [Streptococcus pneumoniae]
MYSGKKFLLFSLLGILLGYLFHRLTLLYDSYSGNTLDKWTHLLMEGQDEVLQSPWNVSFTGKSSAFFLLGFVMMLLVYLYLETGKKQYREGVEYGSARFGTLKEKKLFYGKEFSHDTILAQDVRLTLLDKKSPQYDRNKNIAVIGGSGSGKTFRFVKPNLIQMNSSNIVVDPKDHLAEKTGKLFLEHGYQVKVLDLVNMKNSDGFNPFRYIETENDLNRMLTVYFNNTKGSGSRAEISKLIKHLSKGENQEKSVLEILFENYAKKYGTENFTMRNWADFQNYKDKTLDSVIAVTTAKFALFNIQSVMDLTKRDTLDMKTWGKEKSMVYLVIPDNDSTFRFLSALFFSTVFQTLTRQADIDFKGQLPLHVRVYLDEFANIGEIPDFAEQTSTVRSRNMSLVPILQNIAQLQGLYKEKEAWKTILGNCDSLVYLGGNDEDTFKFMSGLLGKQTIDVRNTSRSFGQTGSGSLSHQKIARDLMTPDEVGNMKRHECLVRIANMPVFKSKKYNSTKHPNWKYLANQENDERWWNYQINPLNQSQENHLEGLRIRDLTFESSLK